MKYLVLFSGLSILIGLFIWGVISYKFPTYPQMQTYEDVIDYASKHHIALPDTQALKDSALAYYRQSMDGETRMLSLSKYNILPSDEGLLTPNNFDIESCQINDEYKIIYFYISMDVESYLIPKKPSNYCSRFTYIVITVAYHYPTKHLAYFQNMDWDIPEHRYHFRDFITKTGITYTSYREYVKILDKCYSNDYSYCHNFLGLQDLVRTYWKTTYYDSLYNDDKILARGKNIHYSAFRAVENIYILSFHDSIANDYQILAITKPYPYRCGGDHENIEDDKLEWLERKKRYP